MRNKFRSIGVKQKANHIFTAPISRDSMSSEEHELSSRLQGLAENKRENAITSLQVHPIMKQVFQKKEMPYSQGFSTSVFMDDPTSARLLPQEGITRADKAREQDSIQRQVQQFNAGIFTPEMYKKRDLLLYASRKKAADMHKKIVEYLATSSELTDPIPFSLQEEVEKYYRDHPNFNVTTLKQQREQKKTEAETKAAEERAKAAFFNDPHPFTGVTFNPGGSVQYSDNFTNVDRGSSTSNTMGTRVAGTNLHLLNFGNNPDSVVGSGWRATPLHRLIRPYKKFELPIPPDQIIEGQKEEKDDWREQYKEEQEFQRGIPPPKDMVERAYPKYARPAYLPGRNIPNAGIVPHDFLFPRKKYWVRHGLY